MISNIMAHANTNIFVITVHMFLLTTTWCLMMWMDYTHTHLKQRGRLVLLKSCRVVSLTLIFIEFRQFVSISETQY